MFLFVSFEIGSGTNDSSHTNPRFSFCIGFEFRYRLAGQSPYVVEGRLGGHRHKKWSGRGLPNLRTQVGRNGAEPFPCLPHYTEGRLQLIE